MRDIFIKYLTAIILVTVSFAGDAAGFDPDFNPPASLFTDKRAFRVGDVVTILLEEYTTGSNQAATNSDFDNRYEIKNSAGGKLDFIPGMNLKTEITGDNQNTGGTSRTGTLTGKIAASVLEILPNGNLRLEGRREVEINGERQVTILTGIVRPTDIRADNSVFSYMIADATITFRGKGDVDQASRPGILARLFGWLF